MDLDTDKIAKFLASADMAFCVFAIMSMQESGIEPTSNEGAAAAVALAGLIAGRAKFATEQSPVLADLFESSMVDGHRNATMEQAASRTPHTRRRQ